MNVIGPQLGKAAGIEVGSAQGEAAPVKPKPAQSATEVPFAPVHLDRRGEVRGAEASRFHALRPLADAMLSLERLPITTAPENAELLRFSSGESPLVGLSVEQLERIAALRTDGIEASVIPRQPRLTSEQRCLENQFVAKVALDPKGTVAQYRQLVGPSQIFEVDLAKHLIPEWGEGKRPANDAERQTRSMGNIALHGTAQVVTALAFLQRLDELALLPQDSEKKHVLVTLGPVAAGKSQLINLLKATDRLNFGAILDAAGEGHAFDAHWVFSECQKRDIPLMVACCVNEPQVNGLLERARQIGRLPDAMTFAASYEQMPKATVEFFSRADVRQALATGVLTTLGIHPGKFDKRSLAHPGEFKAFPDLRVLGKDEHGALILPPTPSVKDVIADKMQKLAVADLPPYLLDAALIGTVLWKDHAKKWLPEDLRELVGWEKP
ncbi:MAG: hypothetical protein AAF735_06470 [Myxococcota bacterium]